MAYWFYNINTHWAHTLKYLSTPTVNIITATLRNSKFVYTQRSRAQAHAIKKIKSNIYTNRKLCIHKTKWIKKTLLLFMFFVSRISSSVTLSHSSLYLFKYFECSLLLVTHAHKKCRRHRWKIQSWKYFLPLTDRKLLLCHRTLAQQNDDQDNDWRYGSNNHFSILISSSFIWPEYAIKSSQQ